MKDLKNKTGLVQLLEPTDLAHTTTKSKLLDLAGFNGAVLEVSIAALTGVDGSNYVTPKLQESDTTADTAFTDVSSDDLIGAFSAVNSTSLDSVIQSVGYKGVKRYVRVVLTYTGTAITAGVIGVTGILGLANVEPVSAPAAVSAT